MAHEGATQTEPSLPMWLFRLRHQLDGARTLQLIAVPVMVENLALAIDELTERRDRGAKGRE